MTIKRFAVLLAKNGLLVAALLLTAALSAVTTMRIVLTSREVVVPSVLDTRVPQARELAARHGLMLRVEGERNDPRVPVGRIMAQEPSAGTSLKSRRSIRAWLSLGPRHLTVPAVEGASLRSARLALEQAQVPLARVVEVDDPAEEGTVLVQRPAAGETSALEEGASLLVSRGAGGADYLMPDLIGRPAEGVVDLLGRAGLKVADIRYRNYPGVAPGTVLRQTPPAGYRVSRRTTVSLDISKAGP